LEAKSLIKEMLNLDPAKRPTAEEALNSAWFRRFVPEHFCSPIEHETSQFLDTFDIIDIFDGFSAT
jgi:serine/threonine protein kinase